MVIFSSNNNYPQHFFHCSWVTIFTLLPTRLFWATQRQEFSRLFQSKFRIELNFCADFPVWAAAAVAASHVAVAVVAGVAGAPRHDGTRHEPHSMLPALPDFTPQSSAG